MKRYFSRVASLFASLLLGAFFLVPSSASAATLLTTCADIQAIPSAATGVYTLANDIDCTGVGFTPIDNFRGTFEGDGHTVTNISILTDASNIGFFARFGTGDSSTVIENLNIANMHVTTTGFYVGLLAATSDGGIVNNVSVSGTIDSAAGYVGGLIGITDGTVVTRAQADVAISVTGSPYIGGLIGIATGPSVVSRSSSSGSVIAGSYTGGLIGIGDTGAVVTSSYSVASVSGVTFVGGLIGVSESTNSYVYAAGEVAFSGFSGGGLIGTNGISGGMTNGYWDMETSLQGDSAAGSGTSTIAMQTLATFAGWDFDTIWSAPSSGIYPQLRPFDASAPTDPGTPTADNPTRYTPLVTWTASTDAGVGLAAEPYTVQWSTSPTFTGTVYTSTTAATTFTNETALDDGTWYYRVSATDRLGQATGYVTSSAIVVDATAPVITRTGEASVSVNEGTVYADAGATALDAVQGDLTSSLVVTNPVDTSVVGTYTVSYAVTDAAGNAAEPVLRTVRVAAVNHGGGGASPSVQPTALQTGPQGTTIPLTMTINGSTLPVRTVSSGIRLGFNGDPSKVMGYALSLRSDFAGASIYPYRASIDYQLPTQATTYTVYAKLYSTTGDASPVMTGTVELTPAGTPSAERSQETSSSARVPTSSSYVFKRNLRFGMEGEDVRELQKILNKQGFLVAKRGNGSVGKESTYFGASTARALARFQEKYRSQLLAPLSLTTGTGYFLGATRTFVNAGSF